MRQPSRRGVKHRLLSRARPCWRGGGGGVTSVERVDEIAAAGGDAPVRLELLDARHEVIADAVEHADPMTLRAVLFQLTGDEEIAATKLRLFRGGFGNVGLPDPEGVALLRRKAAEFLTRYRDAGAGPIAVGPKER